MNVIAKQKYLFIILLIGIFVRLGVEDNPVNQWTSSDIDSKELEYFALDYDNPLEVFVTEAVNMNDKSSNSIGIQLKLAINELEKKDLRYDEKKIIGDLGEVTIRRNLAEPYWKLSDKTQVIGVGTKGLGIPSKLYELIPRDIKANIKYSIEFFEDNTSQLDLYMIFDDIDNIYKEEIKLNQIGLSKEYFDRMNHGFEKSLHLVANYDFAIPITYKLEDEKISLILDEEKEATISIKGVLPLSKDIRVK